MFGWAKPVPVNVGRLRNPARDHMLVAAAGPISNMLLATLMFGRADGAKVVVSGRGGPGSRSSRWYMSSRADRSSRRWLWLRIYGMIINVILAMFNLIPVAPLDGAACFRDCCLASWRQVSIRCKPYSFMIFILLLVSGIPSYLFDPPICFLAARPDLFLINYEQTKNSKRHAADGPASSGSSGRRTRQLGPPAGRVRLLSLHRRLACADHALRFDRTTFAPTSSTMPWTGWPPDSIRIARRSSFSRKVLEHAELHLLLSMITPLGWLERVPTYKEQMNEITGHDLHTYGFLGYPLLQSADILIYKANAVPVGEDQVAHIELTREIARRFNHLYRPVFPEPQALLTKVPKLAGHRRPEDEQELRQCDRADGKAGSHEADAEEHGDGSGPRPPSGSRQSGYLSGWRLPQGVFRRKKNCRGGPRLSLRRNRLHRMQNVAFRESAEDDWLRFTSGGRNWKSRKQDVSRAFSKKARRRRKPSPAKRWTEVREAMKI